MSTKMLRIVSVLCLACSCSGMSMVAKSSKSMTMTSPDGAKKMFVEHSATSDLDSSASGYIYQSDGKNPATIVKLGEANYHEPQEFSQLINQGFIRPAFDAKYLQEKGEENSEGYYSNNGEKGGKGYQGYNEFNDGLLKKFIQDQDSGFYKEAGGGKKSHHDEAGSYGGSHEAKKGESGESFDNQESHKKGHKTTGFHNIYHKDEFKKQHSFYDESDNSGFHDKYGKGDESFAAEKGGYKKGGHSNSGYHAGGFGKKGGYDKGSFSGGSKGYSGVEGGNSHFANNADYGNKGGSSFQKGFGFTGDSGYGYGH